MADSAGAIDLSGLRNPFSRSSIPDAWTEAEGDVADVHKGPFEAVLRLLDCVEVNRCSTGVALTGFPGSGKTHLLSRLRAHLLTRRPEVVFVYIRLETSANYLQRFLRRCFVENLLRPAGGGIPQLQRILASKGDHRAFEAYLDGAGFSFNLSTALRNYRHGEHRNLCAQWLAGDALSLDALHTLGMAPPADDEDSLEDEALRILIALIRLNEPHPVVLCGDMVESLEAFPGDPRGLHAYVRTASALHDAQPNLLVVSCMQSGYWDQLTGDDSAYHRHFQHYQDRIWKHRENLRPLSRDEARALVRARLQMIPELARTAAAGSLWPLREEDFEPLFAKTEACEARRVIRHAEQVFESRRRGGALPAPESPERFLARRFEALCEQALRKGTEALETVLAHGLPKLLALEGVREQERRPEHARAVDMAFGDGQRSTAVSFCHQAASALPRRLKRLLEADVTGAYGRVVLIRPAALGIGAQALKTRDYLKTLEARGACLVQPPADAMAALDALRILLADAQSGDLACEGQTVEPKTVAAWLTANLPGSLRDLLDQIRGQAAEEKPASRALARDLVDYVAERHVVAATEAGERLHASEEEILECARHCSGQLGVLAGPPAVLFAFVAEGFADESH
jgi:hypothetical protein